MALGEQLKQARLSKKLTPSQVAAATKMNVQTVEALEREDFRFVTAPIYGKGFIKLYAQEVGLDPAPLIQEYLNLTGKPKKPSLISEVDRASLRKPPRKDEDEDKPKETVAQARMPAGEEADLFSGRPVVDKAQTSESPRNAAFGGEPRRQASPAQRQPPTAPTQKEREDAKGKQAARFAEFMAGIRSSLCRFAVISAGVCGGAGRAIKEAAPEVAARIRSVRPKSVSFNLEFFKSVPAMLALLLVLVVLISVISRLVSGGASSTAEDSDPDVASALRIVEEPPDQYLE